MRRWRGSNTDNGLRYAKASQAANFALVSFERAAETTLFCPKRMSRNGVIMPRRVYGIFHAHSSADLVAHCSGLPARHALMRPVSHFGTTRNPHRSPDRCSDRHGSIHFSLSPLPTNTARTQPPKAIRLVDSVNRFSDAPTTLSFPRSLRSGTISFLRAHRLLEEKNVNPLLLQLHFALLQSFHRAASVWILHHATNSRTAGYPEPFNILGKAVHSIPLCCLSFFCFVSCLLLAPIHSRAKHTLPTSIQVSFPPFLCESQGLHLLLPATHGRPQPGFAQPGTLKHNRST